MYHEDISNNYTNSTYPEFSQMNDTSRELNTVSSTDCKSSDNTSNNMSNINQNQQQNFNTNYARNDNSCFPNQSNNMNFSRNNQTYAQQNFNYNNYNQDYYSQYPNQMAPNMYHNQTNYNNNNQNQFSQNQFNQNQYNQNQFNQFNDQNYYNQNYDNNGGNNFYEQMNYNNVHLPPLPMRNFSQFPAQNQSFANRPVKQLMQNQYDDYDDNEEGRGCNMDRSRGGRIRPCNNLRDAMGWDNSKDDIRRNDEDYDERDRNNWRDGRGRNDENDDWKNLRSNQDDSRKRKYSQSEEESDTSYDSDTGATKTIYINNVYQKWTEKDIEDSITKHGIVVKSVRIIPRKKPGSGRSFGFADFYKVSEAEKWMDVTQSRLLFPDETIAYLEYSEQARNKAMSKRKDRGITNEKIGKPDQIKRGREGDWSCSKCDFWNFMWRDNCFRCSNVKSDRKSRSRSRSPSDDDNEKRKSKSSSRTTKRSSALEDDDRRNLEKLNRLSSSSNLLKTNISYPVELNEVKYDYKNDERNIDSSKTNNSSLNNKIKPKKTFQEADLWETVSENDDIEIGGSFKAPLPPIIQKKKLESGNKNEKISIEVKLKVDKDDDVEQQQQQQKQQLTAELVASYGESDSDEEDDGDVEHLIDTAKLICLLCKRAFMNSQTLKKHQTQSTLHKENLAEYKRKLSGSAIINTNPLKKL